jgi:phenylalanyl-tRNA synthetase beta chain
MFVSYRWLQRHVDLDGITPEQLATDLTLSTAEVEGLEPFAPTLSDVVVGHVLEREAHPDADKLGVCRVDIGDGEPLQIVCGAPNVRPGHRVAVATVGTRLPGDIKIKKSKIRGVPSVGMICSERELGLGDEHDGIWVLPGEPEVGKPVAGAIGIEDWVIEIDNKSLTHRPDLWGHRGIAREVAAIYSRELKSLDTSLPEMGDGASVAIQIDDDSSCSRYVGLAIDGAAQSKSPEWLKMLLLAVGQRPLDALVDLSNFVMLDLGQPNHTFDRGVLDAAGIIVRRAHEGESMQTLDAETRQLTSEDLLICSGPKPVALAGIMGGEGSKVQGDTTQLLLEVATFDAVRIRRTSSRLGLRTDSSARFEKKLDPTLPLQAAGHFARLLKELQPDVTFPLALSDVGVWTDPAHSMPLNPDHVRRALGKPIEDGVITDILDRLELRTSRSGDLIEVAIPSARSTKDLTIPQDLVEEVGRIYRYGNLPERQLDGVIAPPVADRRREMVRDIQDCLAGGARMHEAIMYSFQHDDLLNTLGLGNLPHVEVINPAAEGLSKIRRSVLPSLIGTLASNRRSQDSVRLFEVGKGYLPECANDKGEPSEVHEVALVLCTPPTAKDARFDAGPLAALQAIIVDLFRSLRVPVATWGAAGDLPPYAHPTKAVAGQLGDQESPAAKVFELEPGVARTLGLEGDWASATAVATVNVDALLAFAPNLTTYVPLPRFPGVKVDVAIIVPDSMSAADIQAVIEQAGKGAVSSTELFDLYRGDSLGEGKRSLAYHVLLQHASKTLSDKDTQKFLGRLERTLEGLGAELRS